MRSLYFPSLYACWYIPAVIVFLVIRIVQPANRYVFASHHYRERQRWHLWVGNDNEIHAQNLTGEAEGSLPLHLSRSGSAMPLRCAGKLLWLSKQAIND